MDEIKTATQTYKQNIGGALSELEDLISGIEDKVFGNPPRGEGIPPQPSVTSANKAEEIRNRIKKQTDILRKINKGLDLL